MFDTQYDVVVIGGGAAGLRAALQLARSRRSVLVLDAGEPRNAPAAGVHGFLSRDGVELATLLELGRAEVCGDGSHVVEAQVRPQSACQHPSASPPSANCSAVMACPFRSCMTGDPGAHNPASTVGRNQTTAEHQDVRHKGNRRNGIQGGQPQAGLRTRVGVLGSRRSGPRCAPRKSCSVLWHTRSMQSTRTRLRHSGPQYAQVSAPTPGSGRMSTRGATEVRSSPPRQRPGQCLPGQSVARPLRRGRAHDAPV